MNMGDAVIRVENLSKQYRIGRGEKERYQTLRDTLTNIFFAPIRWLHPENKNAQPDAFWALKDVSFEVKRGEVMGIIGRNGAGKSTLLKIISRITDPTEGVVDIYGRVGSLLEVGTGFHPELTGRENVYLNGAILGMKKGEIDRKFDEIVSFAGTEKFIDTPVKRYSTGMYLRLAFSVAAHIETEVLLVDEVLAVGDAEFQKKCLNKMSDVAQQGRTVLFVSHNMAAVRTLCNTGILLNRGQIRHTGEIKDVIQFYGDLTAAKNEQLSESRLDIEFTDIRLVGTSNSGINVSDPFKIQGRLHIRVPLAGYRLFCILQNEFGETLVHARIDHREANIETPGEYDLAVSFPPLWLKPGLYSLHFKLMASAIASDKARFVSDTITIDVEGEIASEMLLGALTPNVEWKIEDIG